MNVKETNKIVVAGGELNAASEWFLSQIVINSSPQYAKSLAWETTGKEDCSGIQVFIRRPSDVPISINTLTSINAGVAIQILGKKDHGLVKGCLLMLQNLVKPGFALPCQQKLIA